MQLFQIKNNQKMVSFIKARDDTDIRTIMYSKPIKLRVT